MNLKNGKKLCTLSAIVFGMVASGQSYAQTSSGKMKKYIDKSNMDLSVKPGDNFYEYANGEWIKNHPVPASKTRWGSFDLLHQENNDKLKAMLIEAAADPQKSRVSQMIGDFYASGMDSAELNTLGYQPIVPVLEKIDTLSSIEKLPGFIAELNKEGFHIGFLNVSVDPDSKNTNVYIPGIGQAGISLPDRDYYLKNDTRSLTIRKAYLSYIKTILGLIGTPEDRIEKQAQTIIDLETKLARAQFSKVELRDPYKSYNKFAISDLSKLNTYINWNEYLNQRQIVGADSVIVENPGFLKTVDTLLSSIALEDWKTYLKWNILKGSAEYLSQPFVDANFQFSKILTGQKAPTPRWEKMSALLDGLLGDFVGQLYVEKYFSPEAKERMLSLVNNLQQTFGDRIKRLDWMSEETKEKALIKLAAFTKKIGYPDKWKTYDGLTIKRNDFLGNILNARKWYYNFEVNHMGKPVDKSQWDMTPPTINAYYNPVFNEICFPAGILQFPFFDFGADDAVNYGAIGAVIGHEMTHGFDDEGRQYAADGNLKNWWNAKDAENFKERADKVVKQFNALTVQNTIHVNGELTLGENLADLGGVNIALEAFSKTAQYKERKKIDGFTPIQRFFLSYAQVWRSNILPEREAQLIVIDPHSPAAHRTNAPLSNIDAWYKAFNVMPGDKMYKPESERIKVW